MGDKKEMGGWMNGWMNGWIDGSHLYNITSLFQ